MSRNRGFLVFALFAFAAAPAHAQFDQLLKSVEEKVEKKVEEKAGGNRGPASAGGLSDPKIRSGLAEALKVAAEKSVGLTGRPDGYFGNPAIRIPMPEQLHAVEKGLRAAGMGDKADELVLSMNRAAERAAPAAKQIFLDAISAMSIEDARRIFDGGDTAATEYFRDRTSDRLTGAFAPVVKRSMGEVGTARSLEALLERVKSIPFLGSATVDLDAYVVQKSLGGLFQVMGEQEREIRRNPAARTTQLLQDVFGKQ